MLELDPRKMMNSASALTATVESSGVQTSRPKTLSSAALTVAAEAVRTPYSPIVLAGTVRMIEFALTALVGFAAYVGYVVPLDGFEWHYVPTIFGIAALAMLAFQAADIYQVQAFRGYEKQYFRLASAWSLVFLLAIGVTFFAKLGDQYSSIWLATFYVAGLLVLLGFRRALFLLVRRWTRQR